MCNKLEQLSIFVDGDVEINKKCKPVSKTFRETAQQLADNGLVGSKNCVYQVPSLTSEEEECYCQIAQMKNRAETVPPDIEHCGTTKCIYYITKGTNHGSKK